MAFLPRCYPTTFEYLPTDWAKRLDAQYSTAVLETKVEQLTPPLGPPSEHEVARGRTIWPRCLRSLWFKWTFAVWILPSPPMREKQTTWVAPIARKVPTLSASPSLPISRLKARKSPSPEIGLLRRNSRDISKAFSQSGSWEFDPSQVSHAVTRPKIVVNFCAKTLQLRGFCLYPDSENLPKVSGPNRKNSRFEETIGGDGFDHHCAVEVAVGSFIVGERGCIGFVPFV